MLVHKFSLGHPPNLVNLQTWPSGFPSSFSSFHAVTFPTWCLSTWKENKSSLLCLQEGVALCLLLSTFLKRLIKITFPLRLLFRFRRGFKQFFRCCPFVHVGPEVLTRREVLTSRYSCSGSPDHHRIVRNGKSTSAKVSISKSEALMSKVSHFLFPPDTERSFLYSCSGSPKSHRKSHGEHNRMNNFKAHSFPPPVQSSGNAFYCGDRKFSLTHFLITRPALASFLIASFFDWKLSVVIKASRCHRHVEERLITMAAAR